MQRPSVPGPLQSASDWQRSGPVPLPGGTVRVGHAAVLGTLAAAQTSPGAIVFGGAVVVAEIGVGGVTDAGAVTEVGGVTVAGTTIGAGASFSPPPHATTRTVTKLVTPVTRKVDMARVYYPKG